MTPFFQLLDEIYYREWNNKAAAERRQMFLIGGRGGRACENDFLHIHIYFSYFQGLPEKLRAKLQAIAADPDSQLQSQSVPATST